MSRTIARTANKDDLEILRKRPRRDLNNNTNMIQTHEYVPIITNFQYFLAPK